MPLSRPARMVARLAIAMSLCMVALAIGVAGARAAGTTWYAAPGALGSGTTASDPIALAGALDLVAPGDTIDLESGTYIDTTTPNYQLETAGSASDAAVTIQAAPGDASAPIISGGGTTAALTIDTAVPVDVSGVTIADGNAPLNVSLVRGSGIDANDDLTVTDSTFTGNTGNAPCRMVTSRALPYTRAGP